MYDRRRDTSSADWARRATHDDDDGRRRRRRGGDDDGDVYVVRARVGARATIGAWRDDGDDARDAHAEGIHTEARGVRARRSRDGGDG